MFKILRFVTSWHHSLSNDYVHSYFCDKLILSLLWYCKDFVRGQYVHQQVFKVHNVLSICLLKSHEAVDGIMPHRNVHWIPQNHTYNNSGRCRISYQKGITSREWPFPMLLDLVRMFAVPYILNFVTARHVKFPSLIGSLQKIMLNSRLLNGKQNLEIIKKIPRSVPVLRFSTIYLLQLKDISHIHNHNLHNSFYRWRGI